MLALLLAESLLAVVVELWARLLPLLLKLLLLLLLALVLLIALLAHLPVDSSPACLLLSTRLFWIESVAFAGDSLPVV